MKFERKKLIEDLQKRTRAVVEETLPLLQLEPSVLNWKPDRESWSILECIEHLNRYGDFYLPEIDRQLKKASASFVATFKSGVLGNYFAKILLPGQNSSKMKTLAPMNPAGSHLDASTLKRFLNQQEEMLRLLDRCQGVNLTKVRTGVSISKLIKLRLGDTLRVVIYHNQRHLAQVQRILHQAADQSVAA